jgi:minimal PKS chain-length factor (CLF/KS beta)
MAPNGLGAETYWATTRNGKSGIGRIIRFDPTGYPVRLAGEVRGFIVEEHLSSRLIPQTEGSQYVSAY